jgi:hypothetical protein
MSVKNLKRLFSFRALVLLLGLLLLAVQVRADWINLTGAETAPNIAEIYIYDDHVKLQLEIYPEDLETFKDLIPDDWTARMNIQRPPLEVRQTHFANHTLVIKAADGEILPARFVTVEPRVRIDRQSPFAGLINP